MKLPDKLNEFKRAVKSKLHTGRRGGNK